MKQRLRLALLWCLRAAGGFALARYLTRDAVMIIGWHGVSLESEHQRFPSLFISGESLRRRLAFLSRHYSVIDLDDLVSQHGQGRFRPRQVVLTFDDGFDDFNAVAAPILRSFAMTATNYLVSDFFESGAPNYRMMVRDIIRLAPRRDRDTVFPGGTTVAPTSGVLAVEQVALREFDALDPSLPSRAAYVSALGSTLSVDVAALIRSRIWHTMTPATIRSLANEGYGMQLHTHSHLNVVEYASVAREQVARCREGVERVTGRPAVHFCYPSGLWAKAIWPTLAAQGVLTATTTRIGPNLPTTPLLALRRLMNGEDRSQLEFEFELSNLRWLIARATGKVDASVPSEKLRPYGDGQGNL